jgi:hypothetical protein
VPNCQAGSPVGKGDLEQPPDEYRGIHQHDWRLAALKRTADQLQKQPEAHLLVVLVTRG